MPNIPAKLARQQTEIAFHPVADTFPLMEGEEFDALVADVKQHGLNEPIVLYENKVLDGRNRHRACRIAGVDQHYRQFSGTYAEAVAFVFSANIHRRHLTPGQKRDAITRLVKLDPRKSDRQIAETVKADHKTVAAVRRKAEGRGEIPHVATRTDSRGRDQPASKVPKKLESTGEQIDLEDAISAVTTDVEASANARKAAAAIEEAQLDNVTKHADFMPPADENITVYALCELAYRAESDPQLADHLATYQPSTSDPRNKDPDLPDVAEIERLIAVLTDLVSRLRAKPAPDLDPDLDPLGIPGFLRREASR
jgi:hypothetical protein